METTREAIEKIVNKHADLDEATIVTAGELINILTDLLVPKRGVGDAPTAKHDNCEGGKCPACNNGVSGTAPTAPSDPYLASLGDPGEGWRLVQPGEIIEKGDQYTHNNGVEWTSWSTSVGVSLKFQHGIYTRRRIAQGEKAVGFPEKFALQNRIVTLERQIAEMASKLERAEKVVEAAKEVHDTYYWDGINGPHCFLNAALTLYRTGASDGH